MTRDTPTDPALLKLFGWVMIVLALPYAWFAHSRAWTKIDSLAWPAVTAEVLSSSMYQRTGRQTDWCIKVSYRYRVGGEVYTRHRPGVSMLGNAGCDPDRAVVQRWLATLRPGGKVAAYYDRGDPGHSAIYVARPDGVDYVLCLTSLLFLVGGGLMLRHASRLPPLRWTKT